MFRLNYFLAAVCMALVPLIGYTQQRATPVGVDEVRAEPMSQTIPVLGRFVAPQSGIVAARAGGPVAKIDVNVGDHVERGQVLVKLDQDRLRIQLDLQEAELLALEASRKTAEANQKYAEQELARIERLRQSAAFSKYDYDKRQQELDVARSQRLEAEARIARGKVNKELAEIELRDGEVRAPFPGIVTQRHTSEGAWLQRGASVVTLINDEELEIEADVPANRLAGVKPGVQVMALLDDSSQFTATVRAVIPDEHPSARTRPVRFVLSGDTQQKLPSQQRFAINQSVTLMLPASGADEVISVSKDAVLRRGEQALVYVVTEGAAQPRPVQLGEAVGDRFRVTEGLAPGDVVVVRGNERLRPGQAVSYPNQPQPQAADKQPVVKTDKQAKS